MESEKKSVVLTKEQAHEFESFKTLRSSLEEWARDKQDPNAAHSIIHELTFDEMARAYYIGYEIEPEKPNKRNLTADGLLPDVREWR